MRAVFRRRPTTPLVVSLAALVVAMSGTAVAAGTLTSGDKLIKKHSLSGNRLVNHTLTGKQINLNKLGKVPSAKNADHATVADSATTAATANNATNATNATTATNATELGGQPASAFAAASNTIASGLVKASSGQRVPVASFGPFSITLACNTSAGNITAELDGTTTQDGSDVNSMITSPAQPPVTLANTTNPAGTFYDDNGWLDDFIAPSGPAYQGDLMVGTSGFGSDCFATALIEKS